MLQHRISEVKPHPPRSALPLSIRRSTLGVQSPGPPCGQVGYTTFDPDSDFETGPLELELELAQSASTRTASEGLGS
jgi:hypothetical protein